MSGRSEFSKRIKELRGDRSQGRFAKAIGIPQPNISAYEAGEKVPGYKPLVAFLFESILSGRKDLAGWFAAKTGDRNLLFLAETSMEGDLAHKARLASREVPPHPIAMATAETASTSLHELRLPGWIAEGHRTPVYMPATDDFVFPYRRGDVILLDSLHAGDLSKLVGHEVVAFRPDHFRPAERRKLENKFAEKMNPDEVKRRRARRQFPFLRTGVFVGRLVIDQGGMSAIEVRTKSGDMLLEYLPVQTGKADDLTRERFAELQVLGEWRGCLVPARTTGGQGYTLDRMLRSRGFPVVAEPKK
jgi:transcriptional regulator with XRE-family HTH domain